MEYFGLHNSIPSCNLPDWFLTQYSLEVNYKWLIIKINQEFAIENQGYDHTAPIPRCP